MEREIEIYRVKWRKENGKKTGSVRGKQTEWKSEACILNRRYLISSSPDDCGEWRSFICLSLHSTECL